MLLLQSERATFPPGFSLTWHRIGVKRATSALARGSRKTGGCPVRYRRFYTRLVSASGLGRESRYRQKTHKTGTPSVSSRSIFNSSVAALNLEKKKNAQSASARTVTWRFNSWRSRKDKNTSSLYIYRDVLWNNCMRKCLE